MSQVEVLAQRRRRVIRMTWVSAACYIGFLATSAAAAMRGVAVEHPLTMGSLVLVASALLLLPRSYLPATGLGIRPSEEEGAQLEQLAKLQRTGLLLRFGYLIGAILTIVALPTLLRS